MGVNSGLGIEFGAGATGALVIAIRSDNSQPAVFADIAARDTYTATTEGTADAARINVTNADDAREVFAIGTLAAGEVTAVTSAFIRLNGAWVAVATNLIGQRGADGTDGTVNIPSLTEGDFVMGGSVAGTLVPASMSETTSRIEGSKPLAAPGERTIDIGPISAVSEGSTVSFLDRSRSRMFGPAIHETTSGSVTDRRLFYFRPADSFTVTPSTATATETFAATTLQYQVVNTNLGTVSEYREVTRTAGAAEITGANLIIRRNSHADANPVFDYIRDVTGGSGFTLPAGDTPFTIDLVREHLLLAGETLYITIEGDGSTPLNLRGQTISGQTVPHIDSYGRLGTIVFAEDALGNPASDGQILASTTAGVRSWVSAPVDDNDFVNSSSIGVDSSNIVTLTLGRTGSLADLTSDFQLIAGSNVTLTPDTVNGTITIASSAGGTTPSPGPSDLRYGLSTESNPASVTWAGLTDVASPTDPQTVSTGTTSAGDYFHIFSASTHDIQTITDTVLQQTVYQEGGSGNIFTKVSSARTESSVVYDAYTVGPLNAGVDEEYVLAFS
jgi:hypothetical protein